MKRLSVGFLLLASVAVLTSFPAHAGTHVSVNVGYGYPAYYGHPYHHDYWGPRYYRPYYGPRVVVFPAPVYYPRPVYYPPAYPVYPAPVAVAAPAATQQCTQYNGDATVDGSGQPFYGRACLFTDGRWHIVP